MVAAVLSTGLVVALPNCKKADPQAAEPKPEPAIVEAPEKKILNADHMADDSTSWQDRLDKVREMPDELTDRDIEGLFEVVAKLDQERDEDNIVIINEIMEVLEERHRFNPVYVDAMLAIVSSPERSDVIRDYAIQHVVKSVVYDPASEQGLPVGQQARSISREEKLKVFDVVLAEAANPSNKNDLLAGTAINMLGNSLDGFALDENREQQYFSLLDRMVTGEHAMSRYGRVTAIQISSQLQKDTVAPKLRTIISDESESLDARISAVAGLGVAGDESDIESLQILSASSNRIKYAAKAALQKIQTRTRDNGNNTLTPSR